MPLETKPSWAKQNPVRAKEWRRRYHEKNKAARNAQNRAWMAAHREERKRYDAEYRAQNAEKVKAAERAYHQKHRTKILARNKAWKAANPDKVKAAIERRNFKIYGMTREDYDQMLAAQDGRCACCGSMESGRKSWGRLTIDHDHETGAVRALLCATCNAIAGQAGDNPARLRAVARYLEEHGVVVQVVALAG